MDIDNLEKLIDILTLEKLDHCLYRGQNYVTPWGRIFGGQVLGQALAATYDTVPGDRLAHSLHGYFILPGDVSKPVIYQVDETRDGGSFTTRRVRAIQNGKAIFVMAVSFQKEQEGFEHQDPMPNVVGPEGLESTMEQLESIRDEMPNVYKNLKSTEQGAIDIRSVEPLIPKEKQGKPLRNIWMKTTKPTPMDMKMQHCMLAYVSDYNLLLTAAYPHRNKFNIDKLFIASLDHAMWFHRSFDLNDWILFNIKSPSASNSRGMGFGRMFTKKGELVSTVMQEGLIRMMR